MRRHVRSSAMSAIATAGRCPTPRGGWRRARWTTRSSAGCRRATSSDTRTTHAIGAATGSRRRRRAAAQLDQNWLADRQRALRGDHEPQPGGRRARFRGGWSSSTTSGGTCLSITTRPKPRCSAGSRRRASATPSLRPARRAPAAPGHALPQPRRVQQRRCGHCSPQIEITLGIYFRAAAHGVFFCRRRAVRRHAIARSHASAFSGDAADGSEEAGSRAILG